MDISIDVISDRTDKNSFDIVKIFKVLFGNGKCGLVSEVQVIKTKLALIVWLVGIQLSATIGVFVKIVFFTS